MKRAAQFFREVQGIASPSHIDFGSWSSSLGASLAQSDGAALAAGDPASVSTTGAAEAKEPGDGGRNGDGAADTVPTPVENGVGMLSSSEGLGTAHSNEKNRPSNPVPVGAAVAAAAVEAVAPIANLGSTLAKAFLKEREAANAGKGTGNSSVDAVDPRRNAAAASFAAAAEAERKAAKREKKKKKRKKKSKRKKLEKKLLEEAAAAAEASAAARAASSWDSDLR